MLRFVRVVAHGPAQGLDPRLHDVGCPLDAIEFRAVTQHGYNISGVFFLVAYELESNTPKHGYANDNETWRFENSVHINVIRLLGVVVNRVV